MPGKNAVQLKGTVRASRYRPEVTGKQFLGVLLQAGDGREWVIDYEEESPYHAFDNCEVVAFGQFVELNPDAARIMENHFRVLTMRLAEVTPDSTLVEIGKRQCPLAGRVWRGAGEGGETQLYFATDDGRSFLVANDPAGARIGARVEVAAYPLRFSPSKAKTDKEYLWILCPCSAADTWDWRKRSGWKNGLL